MNRRTRYWRAMKNLGEAAVYGEVVERVGGLEAGRPALWGKMNAGQMMCHLSDSYEVGLGERAAATVKAPMPPWLFKLGALYAPMKWPRGVATGREVEQGLGGTPPGVFAADKLRLLELLERFRRGDLARQAHPIFGTMTNGDWLRWGYLHADHHLRQFGG